MLFVNRRARKSTDRGPSYVNFQPRCEGLEAKILLTIDLGGTVAGTNPTIAIAPFGMDFGGGTQSPITRRHRSRHRAPVRRRRPGRRERRRISKTSPSPRRALQAPAGTATSA